MSLSPPPEIAQRLLELQSCLPNAKVVLVGGAVRELLLGRQPKDWDVEVLGLSQEELGAALAELWPGASHCVGRAFAVFKIAFADYELDIAATPVDEFAAAARRRDFTINAVGWDRSSGSFIDPFGGQDDLRTGLLRYVDAVTFVEDPLRVYRAAQFAARLNFAVEPATSQLCAHLIASGALDDLPPERISEEWKKLLLMPLIPSTGLELLRQWGAIERCYPELHALQGTIQDPRWHPEGDVWIHTLLVLDTAAGLIRQPERSLSYVEKTVAVFAALLHDLGKPTTTRGEDKGITAHGHEAAGKEPALRFLQRLRLGEAIELGILDCVTEHMRPSRLTREMLDGTLSPRQAANASRRLWRDVGRAGWSAFITLCEADKRGRGEPAQRAEPYLPAEHLTPLLRAMEPVLLAPGSLLKGRDLIKLGISPGPALGQLIALVEKQRDDGIVATYEEALEWLRAHLNQSGNRHHD